MKNNRFQPDASLSDPPRVGSAKGVEYSELKGNRLVSVENETNMGIVTEVLRDRVRLDGQEAYVCFWAIDLGWYDVKRVKE